MPRRRFSKYFPLAFLLMDLIVLNIGFIISNLIRFDTWWYASENYPTLLLVLNLTWILVYYFTGLQKVEREEALIKQINRVLTALLVNVGLIFTFWVVTKSYYYSREHLFVTYVIFSGFTISWRIVFDYFIKYYRTKGYNIRHVVILGNDTSRHSLEKYFHHHPELGYVYHGCFSHTSYSEGLKGDINDFYAFTRRQQVDIVFCCLPKLYTQDIKQVVDYAENNLIKVKLVSNLSPIHDKNLSIQKYGEVPVINISSIPLDIKANRFIKRTFDIIFSSVMILFILSWLVPLIGLLIRLESKGPIFFKQYRHGKNNQYFLCWKFRTMVVNNEADSKQCVKGDSRVTAIGHILRRSSLDELPQFINVFKGDMSVVGPRPHPIRLNEQFSPQIDRFYQRHAVKPGITGLAQAKGYRGETNHFRAMYGRVRLDRFYVKNWSLFLDLQIIVLTIIAMIRNNENAY